MSKHSRTSSRKYKKTHSRKHRKTHSRKHRKTHSRSRKYRKTRSRLCSKCCKPQCINRVKSRKYRNRKTHSRKSRKTHRKSRRTHRKSRRTHRKTRKTQRMKKGGADKEKIKAKIEEIMKNKESDAGQLQRVKSYMNMLKGDNKYTSFVQDIGRELNTRTNVKLGKLTGHSSTTRNLSPENLAKKLALEKALKLFGK